MNKDRWQAIQSIFEEAVDLSAAAQPAFLEHACKGDNCLKQEVMDLLAHDKNSASVLQAVVGQQLEALFPDEDSSAATSKWLGQQLGSWRIIAHIADGGMGAIYKAERADKEYEQTVALKLINPAFLSDNFRNQFTRERQILARLTHPNIAGLIDGGTTEDGVPYLVMEYVDGLPINAYCDMHKLSVRERLVLFQKICASVDYAHKNLIVHRDLKPNNILVNNHGQPKLLDFGIAKILEFDDSASRHSVLKMLTPTYASPEQIRGELVTTASDVFSLGVLLYELLAGNSPYTNTSSSNEYSVAHQILDVEPRPPSHATEAGSSKNIQSGVKRKKELRGDLDTIVMKALQKEVGRRYGSVGALSDDIDRYLQHQPLFARADNIAYRLHKFVLRNTWSTALVSFTFVSMMALVGFYTLQLKTERDKAQLEATRSTQLYEFLIGIFKGSDPNVSLGEKVTARELLDDGAKRVQFELTQQPQVRASLQNLIGDIYASLGLLDQAKEQLVLAYELRKASVAGNEIQLAQSLTSLAELSYGQGAVGEAENYFRQALTLLKTELDQQDPAISVLESKFARLLDNMGKVAEAEKLYLKTLEVQRQQPGVAEKDQNSNSREDLARTLHNYGWLLLGQDRLDKAEQIMNEALHILMQTHGELHPSTASVLNDLSFIYKDQGRFNEAEAVTRRSLAVWVKIFGEDHLMSDGSRASLASLLHEKGNFKEAEAMYRLVLTSDIRHVGEDHPYVATDKNNLAGLLTDRARYDEAEVLYKEAYATNVKLFGPDHFEAATCLSNLGRMKLLNGQLSQAKDYLNQAFEIRKRTLGYEHAATISSLDLIASYQFESANYTLARQTHEESLRLRLATAGEDNILTAVTLFGYVRTLMQLNEYDLARQFMDRLLTIYKATYVSSNPKVAMVDVLNARLLMLTGDISGAEAQYRDTIKRLNAFYTYPHPEKSKALLGLSELLLETGRAAEALTLLDDAKAMRTILFGENSWQVDVIQSAQGQAVFLSGEKREGSNIMDAAQQKLLHKLGENSRFAVQAKNRVLRF